MTNRLKYVSNATVDGLRGSVADNLRRYADSDFADLLNESDWSIELGLDADLSPLSGLDPSGTPEAEATNSRLVWQVLGGLTPSLACEEGIWVRLTHVECLEFSRERWLAGTTANDEIEALVRKHFFASGIAMRRDDNALSRLWWNAFIADSVMPGTDLEALEVFLAKADFRQSFVERSETGSRPALSSGIIRIMQDVPWVTAREANFRTFMKKLNQLGGGVLFEAMTHAEVDAFMLDCAQRSGMTEIEDFSGNDRDAPDIPTAAAPPPQ
jgi:hypothetical protein